MLLTPIERLLVLNLLPPQEDITTLRLIRKLKEALSFGEDEHEKLELVLDDNGTIKSWKPEAVPPKEVEIGPKMLSVVSGILEKMNREKKLRDTHIPLYEKFVEVEQ